MKLHSKSGPGNKRILLILIPLPKEAILQHINANQHK